MVYKRLLISDNVKVNLNTKEAEVKVVWERVDLTASDFDHYRFLKSDR